MVTRVWGLGAVACLTLACNAILGIEEGSPRPASADAAVGGASAGMAGAGAAGGATGGTGGAAGAGGSGGSTGGAPSGGGSGGLAGSGGASGGTGGGSGGSADAGIISKCPATPPSTSAPCASGLSCTYGTHPDAACRDSYTCNGSGWTAKLPKCSSVPSCSTLPSFPVIGQPCLDGPGGVVNGTSCELSGPNVICRCVCIGASCTAGQEEWACTGPPSACPSVLPNKGQPCTKPNGDNSCKYYFCDFGWETDASCGSSGTWQWSSLTCP